MTDDSVTEVEVGIRLVMLAILSTFSGGSVWIAILFEVVKIFDGVVD